MRNFLTLRYGPTDEDKAELLAHLNLIARLGLSLDGTRLDTIRSRPDTVQYLHFNAEGFLSGFDPGTVPESYAREVLSHAINAKTGDLEPHLPPLQRFITLGGEETEISEADYQIIRKQMVEESRRP